MQDSVLVGSLDRWEKRPKAARWFLESVCSWFHDMRKRKDGESGQASSGHCVWDRRKMKSNGKVSSLKTGCLLQLPWPKNGFVLLPLLLLSSKRTENTLPKKTAIECPFWWQGNFLLWYLTENF